MEEDSYEEDFPVWQMPVKEKPGYPAAADRRLKYHCFKKGVSLCGRHKKNTTDFMNDIGIGEILSSPEIVCQACFQRWLNFF